MVRSTASDGRCFEGNGRKLGIVVGGGLPAREGITLARESFSDPYRLDTVGIAATRLNATILQQTLQDIGCNVSPIILPQQMKRPSYLNLTTSLLWEEQLQVTPQMRYRRTCKRLRCISLRHSDKR